MSLEILILAGALLAGPGAQDAAPMELPGRAKDALDESFRGWEPVVLAAEGASCLGANAAATSLVRTDLDSDGNPDHALMLRTGEGLRLVAVLHRVPEYQTFELDDLGSDPPATIALGARGARFMPSSGIDDFFPADTLIVRRCGQPDVAYIWTGTGFRRTPLSAGTVPAPAAR